jgi:hypothetical protein
MEKYLRPSAPEVEFLQLSYNRFYDIYDEVMSDNFFEKEPWYRFSRIKDAFAVYSELLNYEPIKLVIRSLKKIRPPMEAEIASELFKFIRNVITHFPFFENWNEVWTTKSLVNWYKDGKTIDKFLEKYKGHTQVKYRFWEYNKKKMSYLSINFPNHYDKNSKVYLKEILTEHEGIKFSFILMRQIMDTQVEKIKDK